MYGLNNFGDDNEIFKRVERNMATSSVTVFNQSTRRRLRFQGRSWSAIETHSVPETPPFPSQRVPLSL